MNRLVEPFRARLQETLSGQQTGDPEWVTAFESGADRGFFGPGSAVWAVHGGMPTLVAGIRALLMQALHPGALAGVVDWSRYREDPLGRLNGTIRWIFTVSYGDTAQAEAGSAWVRRLHERVVGDYLDGHGHPAHYSANDPELATWVHLAFTDAFLTAHEYWGGPIPGGSDAYVDQWAIAGEQMGVPHTPHSRAELKAALNAYSDAGELRCDDRTREVVHFVRHAPVRRMLRPSYAVLFGGAVASLEPRFRELHGLRMPHLGPVPLPASSATRLVLRGAGALLGPQTAGEKAARVRLRALESR
jgi:uncharacterized protein (DUF2236 family)